VKFKENANKAYMQRFEKKEKALQLYIEKYREYLEAEDEKKTVLRASLEKQRVLVMRLGEEFGTQGNHAMKDLERKLESEVRLKKRG